MPEQQNILIGGISGGIGSALARRLHKDGHTVAGFARDGEKLEALSQELEGAATRTCDATDADAVGETIRDLADNLGTVHAYVHAIGSIYLKPAHQTSVEDWTDVLNQNLNSAFYALRAITGIMNKQGHGQGLFFSTAAAQRGIANHEAIAAAKGGLEALVRSAAATYASRGLRFNAIAPSLTDTPLSAPMTGSEKALEISRKMHPLGRIGAAGDVAGLARWLLSDEATFATGQTFVLDGGLTSIVPKPRA